MVGQEDWFLCGRKNYLLVGYFFTDFSIELQIEDSGDESKWWLICVYVSSVEAVKEKQWNIITERKGL